MNEQMTEWMDSLLEDDGLMVCSMIIINVIVNGDDGGPVESSVRSLKPNKVDGQVIRSTRKAEVEVIK